MRRRDFLAMTGALAALPGRRSVSAQPTRRAAVVIGIDKAGDLPVLNAAASGAREMATWLRAEGFQVHEFVDTTGPISVTQVWDAIHRLLSPGTLEQLVVYFAGHGFMVGFGEHWVLSRAPLNPNESISVVESVELARYCRVPNVVFISDACRSTTESLGVNQVRGGLIFPSATPGAMSGSIDRFFAALPGQAALELPVQDSMKLYKGIYTAAFLEAYRRPDGSMVTKIGGVDVVPNRSLKNYLAREVRKRAESFSIRLTQTPDSIIESDAYIGRVRPAVPGDPVANEEPPTPTISDVAAVALARSGVPLRRLESAAFPSGQLEAVAIDTGFSATQAAVRVAVADGQGIPVQFETRTGFVISGAQVESVAATSSQMNPELLDPGVFGAAVIRLRPVPGSLLVRFVDGTGSVLASLPEFIGRVVVESGGIVDVSYLPSQNTARWQDDPQAILRLNTLRGSVAASMQHGVFRFEGNTASRRAAASSLADSIRVLKGLDPTLGVYAAYAYSDAGFIDQVRSVHDIMLGDLNAELFDVALLADALRGRNLDSVSRLVPFCPMLTHGWNLLRVRGIERPDLDELRNHLRQSTWTTFTRQGVDLLRPRFAG